MLNIKTISGSAWSVQLGFGWEFGIIHLTILQILEFGEIQTAPGQP